MKFILVLFTVCLFAKPSAAQRVLTVEDAVAAALQQHPSAKAAILEVEAKKMAEKAALNLSNPEINAESPTGEFYTIGVLQSFEFPTVYKRQKQVAQAETALAQAGAAMSQNELRYQIRSAYLDIQTLEYQTSTAKKRDSLYQKIAAAAVRQMDAGAIDFLQKTLLENEAGKAHQTYKTTAQQLQTSKAILSSWLNGAAIDSILPLSADTLFLSAGFVHKNPATSPYFDAKNLATLSINTAEAAGNPLIRYTQQEITLKEKEVKLAQSKALPNFSVGYMNQGLRNTPLDYRFRASIGVPLWVGQYRAATKSAQTESEAVAARLEAQIQAHVQATQRLLSEAVQAKWQLDYYQQTALPRSQSLIAAALRLNEAGQTDYITFLRTLDEAYAIQSEYGLQLQAFENAKIQLLFLKGQ